MRKRLSSFLKIAVTVLGLIYVISQVPLEAIGGELATLRWPWFVLGVLLVWLSYGVRAFRWWLLWRGLGTAVFYPRLVMLYAIGAFFNAFLPTGFGGDVVRALEASRDVSADAAAGTVIVDRLTGLLTLFAMALLLLPWRPATFPPTLAWQVAAVCLVGLLGGAVFLEGRLIRRWGGWLPGKLSVTDPKQPLARLLTAVQGCGARAVGSAMAVSVLFNLLLVGFWASAARALGYSVPYTYLLLVVPIMAVALLVPSFGGLGVRETLAPLLFAGAGLTDAQAVSLSITVFLMLRLAGLIGAPIYVFSSLRQQEEVVEQQASP